MTSSTPPILVRWQDHHALLIALTMIGIFVVSGCALNNRGIPVQVTDHRKILVPSSEYGRIDISTSDVERGLTEILAQLAQKTGPLHAEPIVKDYAPIVQQALYNTGYCSIQKLNINHITVDIDVYFRTNQAQPALTIDAYLNGQTVPAFTVVNQYYVSAAN